MGQVIEPASIPVQDVNSSIFGPQPERAVPALADGIHFGIIQIPVILNTSKTYAETMAIRETLGINDAFIVENGSCLYLPKSLFSRPAYAGERAEYWSIVLGSTHQVIDGVTGLRVGDHGHMRVERRGLYRIMA